MEPTRDPDVMSGIEPLESSATTSALLNASPGSNSKLSISFGSYHSSLQSSPKNPDQARHGQSPGRQELEEVISPLHPHVSPQSSTFKTNPQFGLSETLKQNQKFAAPANHGTTNIASLPNTPFTQNSLPESQRLMVSADEAMLRDHQFRPHQFQNALPSQTLSTYHTKRELFSRLPQGNHRNPDRIPSSTAYTSASRSYKSYDGAYDKPSVYNHYSKGDVDSTRQKEHKTNFSTSPRNQSYDAESSVRKRNGILPTEMTKSYPEAIVQTNQHSPAHQEIAEMERVRESLHQMINTSSRAQDSTSSTPSDLLLGALPLPEKPQSDSLDSVKTDALLSARPYSDVSPVNVDSGFGLSAFRSLASNASQDVAETTKDTTLNAENHMLRDSLEKERYRRKHCEKQIAELQSKLLETQQQLAVAVSTDRKKDAMIEQLDKTLARLVEGWKKQDQEKTDALVQMKSQKEAAEDQLGELQKLYAKQTSEVNKVKDTLEDIERQNKLALEEYGIQITSLERERSSLTEQLQREQRKLQETHNQHQEAVEKWQRLQRELRQTRQSLLQEKEHQQAAEETLQEQMHSLEKERMEALNKEKARAEEQTEKAHEACELLTAVQRDVEKLKEQLESAIREKENAHLELNLQEARFEAGQRKQEAEWQEEMEKTLSRRLTELQERAQRTETELQESHRGQISDLQEQHQREVGEMRNAHQQEILQREKRLETLRKQYQERLDECQEELARITNKMEDVQHEKTVLVGKLQDVLQAYYSGTLTDTGSQSVTPTHQSQSQTASPVSKRSLLTGDLFGDSPQHEMRQDLPTTPGRRQLLEKQNLSMNYNTGLPPKKDGLSELTASQIASLHSTVQIQHKHHQQNMTRSSSHPSTSHQIPTSQPTDMLQSSPTALSEHEISHISRVGDQHDVSLRPAKEVELTKGTVRTSHTSMFPVTSQSAVGKMHSFREEGLLTGAQPIRLQATTDGHVAKMRDGVISSRFGNIYGDEMTGQRDELVTLQQDPDRSMAESFLDGRGYTSGEFLPLKAATGSPTASILSTGPMSESVSELSSAPLHPTRSNVMLLEKLAEHEQRQMALQHYIQLLLQQSPGATEEERNTTNKPADNSVVMKERLPMFTDSSDVPSWYRPRPLLETKPTSEQQPHPSHQKATPNLRTGAIHPRHIPAERLHSNPPISQQHQQASKPHASGGLPSKQVTQSTGKGRTASQLQTQPSSSGRSLALKPPSKTATVSGRFATAPSRQNTKGKTSRIGPSHAAEKRGGITTESVGKKRGVRGKETR